MTTIRELYHSSRWTAARDATLQRDNCTCRKCGTRSEPYRVETFEGESFLVPLLICCHIEFPRGDETKFFDPTNLQTLCLKCHDTWHLKNYCGGD